eukprot:GHVT01016821.1.p1 GENE.GHVT01016821.1~~GHVT01016821.1.p1  ORF type:complete len:108 (+),score=4.58 GHVT01016821.1:171-494(+)
MIRRIVLMFFLVCQNVDKREMNNYVRFRFLTFSHLLQVQISSGLLLCAGFYLLWGSMQCKHSLAARLAMSLKTAPVFNLSGEEYQTTLGAGLDIAKTHNRLAFGFHG